MVDNATSSVRSMPILVNIDEIACAEIAARSLQNRKQEAGCQKQKARSSKLEAATEAGK